MAAIGHMRIGKNSDVVVEGDSLNFATWRTTDHADDINTTHFNSISDQGTVGVEGVDWNMGGQWDAATNAYDDPPGLYPRDNLGLVKFYENVNDNVFWSLASNRVLSAENGAEVRDKVTFNATGKSNGVTLLVGTSRPTGSV